VLSDGSLESEEVNSERPSCASEGFKSSAMLQTSIDRIGSDNVKNLKGGGETSESSSYTPKRGWIDAGLYSTETPGNTYGAVCPTGTAN